MRTPRGSASATTYDSELRATDAEVEFVKGLGFHLETPREDRLRLLLSYQKTLDWPARDWGHIDIERVRYTVELEIQKETKARAGYIPRNGHGLYDKRSYAKPVGIARIEIRRAGDDPDFLPLNVPEEDD